MKKKLYLITNDFPYGNGENPFIIPELPYLKEHFQVTIISHSLHQDLSWEIDPDIQVVHYNRQTPIWRKLLDTVCFLGHKECWQELWKILVGKQTPLPADGTNPPSVNRKKQFMESIFFFEEARRFQRFLKKSGLISADEPAVVYTYWYTYYTYAAIKLFENSKVKVITRTHRYDLYDEGMAGGRQPFKDYMNRHIHKIVFIAEHGRRYFVQKYGTSYVELTSKCELYRLGVQKAGDSEKQMEETHTENERLLVSCAMMLPRKRTELIIEAIAGIKDLSIKWVHFGDGPDWEYLTDLAAEHLDSMPNISYEFRGFVPSSKITDYYLTDKPDIFITPTASEGCPVSVQEAMSCGIPIIGTHIAEIPFMIEGNGILLSACPTVEEVRSAIREILQLEPAEWAVLAEKSRLLWNTYFNEQINATAFSAFLKKQSEN